VRSRSGSTHWRLLPAMMRRSVRCRTGWHGSAVDLTDWAAPSTADIYSRLPQQTSADPTPGYMHASLGAPDQCYL
jgi:hypothetical protein